MTVNILTWALHLAKLVKFSSSLLDSSFTNTVPQIQTSSMRLTIPAFPSSPPTWARQGNFSSPPACGGGCWLWLVRAVCKVAHAGALTHSGNLFAPSCCYSNYCPVVAKRCFLWLCFFPPLIFLLPPLLLLIMLTHGARVWLCSFFTAKHTERRNTHSKHLWGKEK